jgi:16S rRNA processing protein RimM
MALSAFLEIGKIVAAHGIRGEVRVYPNSDFPERFEKPGQRWVLRPNRQEPEPIQLIKGRYLDGKGLYVLQLEGVNDRTSAEGLRGCTLFVPQTDRPELEDGEFHVSDLIGLPVYHQTTQELVGTVTDVLPAGHDLLEVKSAQGKSVLIPFVEAIVPVVDVQQRRIEITPPDGLIE